MITVRTRKKVGGMTQQQLAGVQEERFIACMAQNFLDFVDKYGEDCHREDSILYDKVSQLLNDKDYNGLEKVFSTVQVFGTYDKITQNIIKYKNSRSAVGNTYNGTVIEGGPDEQSELNRIVAHTCTMCSPEGNAFLEKLLA